MFKLDINLDDEQERDAFIDKYGTDKGRRLANRLGLKGMGSTLLATALSNYAWNAHTAFNCRKCGDIPNALIYEDIKDRIYKDDIRPVCECW